MKLMKGLSQQTKKITTTYVEYVYIDDAALDIIRSTIGSGRKPSR